MTFILRFFTEIDRFLGRLYHSAWLKIDQSVKYCLQWLKCNGTQDNAVPPPPIYGSKRSLSQIAIMLGKGTRPLSGAQT